MEDTETQHELAPVSFEDILTDYERFTDKQTKALGYIAHGFTIAQIANIVKLPRNDIVQWFEQHDFREAAARMYNASQAWQEKARSRLRYLAHEKLEEILSQDYAEADEKERREIARTARFFVKDESVLANAAGNTYVNAPQLNVTESSIDLLAQQIRRLEANDTNDLVPKWDVFEAPRVHALHIDTDYGVINYNADEKEFQCHVCGGWFVDLYSHASKKHSLSEREYNLAFRIPDMH